MGFTESEQKAFSRLCYIAEYGPVNTEKFDYELECLGLVKINSLKFEGVYHSDTSLTQNGINRMAHLAEIKNQWESPVILFFLPK